MESCNVCGWQKEKDKSCRVCRYYGSMIGLLLGSYILVAVIASL